MTKITAVAALVIAFGAFAMTLEGSARMGDATFVDGHWTSAHPCGPNAHLTARGGLSVVGQKFDLKTHRYICD